MTKTLLSQSPDEDFTFKARLPKRQSFEEFLIRQILGVIRELINLLFSQISETFQIRKTSSNQQRLFNTLLNFRYPPQRGRCLLLSVAWESATYLQSRFSSMSFTLSFYIHSAVSASFASSRSKTARYVRPSEVLHAVTEREHFKLHPVADFPVYSTPSRQQKSTFSSVNTNAGEQKQFHACYLLPLSFFTEQH